MGYYVPIILFRITLYVSVPSKLSGWTSVFFTGLMNGWGLDSTNHFSGYDASATFICSITLFWFIPKAIDRSWLPRTIRCRRPWTNLQMYEDLVRVTGWYMKHPSSKGLPRTLWQFNSLPIYMRIFDSDAGSKGLVPSNEALKVDPEPIWTHHLQCFSGWWLTYPSEKYESMGRMTSHIWNGK